MKKKAGFGFFGVLGFCLICDSGGGFFFSVALPQLLYFAAKKEPYNLIGFPLLEQKFTFTLVTHLRHWLV